MAKGVDVHAQYCQDLWNQQERHRWEVDTPLDQQVSLSASVSEIAVAVDRWSRLLQWNCIISTGVFETLLPQSFSDADGPTPALLRFMFAAYGEMPLRMAAFQDLPAWLREMKTVPMVSSFSEGPTHYLIDNVPGAVSSVKAERAIIQVPDGYSTALERVWKVSSVLSRPAHHALTYLFSCISSRCP